MTPPPGVCADSRTGMGGTRADQTLTHLTVHQAQAGRVGRGDSPRRGGAGPSAAWSILRGGEPQPHERVAVLGIGAVGHLAVRFAHACGLQTIAMTISPDKHDVARRLGADEVVAKGAELRAAGGADGIEATGKSYPVRPQYRAYGWTLRMQRNVTEFSAVGHRRRPGALDDSPRAGPRQPVPAVLAAGRDVEYGPQPRRRAVPRQG